MSGNLDRNRLGKLLGLLGSDHEGEVVNAARAAEALRRTANASWADILAGGDDRLDRRQQQLLSRILELERENTRLKAAGRSDRVGELLSENDRLWQRIIDLELKVSQLTPITPPPPEDFDAVLAKAVLWKPYLSDWERGFVDDIRRKRRRNLTPKQTAALNSILDKVEFLRRGAA